MLRVTRSVRAQPGWSDVEVAWESADTALTQVARNLDRLLQALGTQDDSDLPGYESLVAETTACLNAALDVQRQLRSFVASPEDDRIYWMAQEGRAGELALQAAPLHVGDILADTLFSQKSAVTLTSATLRTKGSFAYVRERLGLEDADEALVDSPFDYEKAVLLCLPNDVPDPGARGYQAAVQRAIVDVCRAAGGRTLGLFTSHAALQTTRSGIRAELEGLGIRTLAQGVDGTPRSLLDAFLQNPRSRYCWAQPVSGRAWTFREARSRRWWLRGCRSTCPRIPCSRRARKCSMMRSTSTPYLSRCCGSGRGSAA